MPDSDQQDGQGVFDRLTRALHHGVAAARCFVALLGAEAAAAVNRVARRVVWLAALLFAALLGVVFVLWGAARMLDDWLVRPGLGQVIVGLSVLLLVALVLSFPGEDDDSGKQDGPDDEP